MPCAGQGSPWWTLHRDRGPSGAGDGLWDWSWCSVSHPLSTAANRSGCSTWGRCPQSGNTESRPVGRQVDRGLGMVGGQEVVAAAPDDEGRGGQGGEAVEQDLALPGGAEQGAGHRGGGLELAGGRPRAWCSVRNSAGARQGWANSIAVDMPVRPRSPPGIRLSMMASSPMIGRVSRASSGWTSRPRPALSTRVERLDACGSASGQAQRRSLRPRSARPGQAAPRCRGCRGTSATNGVRSLAWGDVPVGHRGGVAVTGQAQGEDPVGGGRGWG